MPISRRKATNMQRIFLYCPDMHATCGRLLIIACCQCDVVWHQICIESESDLANVNFICDN